MFDRREKILLNAENGYCLSDHHPFIIKSGNNAVCFAWNILVQMKGGKFYNNGFGCELESDEQYNSRLNQLAFQINSAINEHDPAFICLQETPKRKEDEEHFISLINNKYTSESLSSESTQITFYNTELFTYETQLTQKIKDTVLTEGLVNRIIPLVLLDKTTKMTTLLINVHASFGKDIQKDVISLHEAAKENGITHIIFAGDFNRNLTDLQPADADAKHDIYNSLQNDCFHNLHVFSTPDASFMAKKETGTINRILETRDGCLTSINVSLENMMQLNHPCPKNLILLSEDLKNIPEGFNQEKTSSYSKSLG